MLFHSRVLRGFVGGLSVRSPSTSQLPITLRSSSPTMTDQDAPKTYPPPNPVQDGMKTYEVWRSIVARCALKRRCMCSVCEIVTCPFLCALVSDTAVALPGSRRVLCYFSPRVIHPRNWQLIAFCVEVVGGRSGRSRCSVVPRSFVSKLEMRTHPTCRKLRKIAPHYTMRRTWYLVRARSTYPQLSPSGTSYPLLCLLLLSWDDTGADHAQAKSRGSRQVLGLLCALHSEVVQRLRPSVAGRLRARGCGMVYWRPAQRLLQLRRPASTAQSQTGQRVAIGFCCVLPAMCVLVVMACGCFCWSGLQIACMHALACMHACP